jgi:hypothetical protein
MSGASKDEKVKCGAQIKSVHQRIAGKTANRVF